ncbi:MAG: hypothetical protein HON94_08785 [Methylococcales bacterium]|jgi:hypothetical protein|nr:hypothetical protein [Methylococcales bacterium]MBT7410649.1 hypothetical protein [Methylococcales bacterium]
MIKIIDSIPFFVLIMLSIFMSLAPLNAESHLLQKILMLFNGNLIKPLDIFDLIMHSTPLALLTIKTSHWLLQNKSEKNDS